MPPWIRKGGRDTISRLKTAPIDTFENLARAPASDPSRMALVTTALAHGVPVIELDVSALDDGSHDRMLDDPELSVALDEGFAAYCKYAAARWKDQRELYRWIVRSIIVSKPENSHPLVRLMRNHWLWLWYENLLTVRAIRKVHDHAQVTYWRHGPLMIGGQIVCGEHGRPRLLIGPTVIADDGADGSVEAALTAFQAAIEEGWSSVQDIHRPKTLQARSGGKFQLYTSALLARLTAARSRVTWNELHSVSRKILPHYDQLSEISRRQFTLGPYRSIFHLGATITAFDQRPGSDRHRHALSLEMVAPETGNSLTTAAIELDLRYRGTMKRAHEIEEIAKEQGARINSAWRSYIRDSNTILSAWLSRSLWERVTHAGSHDDWGIFGHRLTKFLANVFLANECNIYQVDYSKEVPCLSKIGGFSDDHRGVDKSGMMHAFMRDLEGENRRHSISYRAMENNDLQYVNFEDPEVAPESRRLAFPPGTEWDLRGRSALSLPIQANGMIWGVLELISFNFDHFPFNVRVQLGEVVDTFGSALSFQGMSEMLNQIDRVVADDDLDIEFKRARIVSSLPRYFMSSDVSLVRFRRGAENAIEYSIAAQIGHHASFSPTGNIAHTLGTTFSHMVQQSTPVVSGTFLPDQTFKHASAEFDTIVVLLPFEDTTIPAGAVVIRLALPIRPESAWHHPIQVLGQYFLNAIDNLDTEIYWARNQRTRYGHELIRNINTIEDVEIRLKNLIEAELGQSPRHADLRRLLADLDRAKRSVELYAEALTDATLTSNRFDDPRIAAMKRHLDKNTSRAIRPIDVRDTFHAAIYSRRAESREARINFLPFPSFEYPLIRIDDVLLYDVVATLVDNAIKYALPNTSVGLAPNISDKFEVALSNLGAELRSDEVNMIFEDRFRGRFAEQHLANSGLGLGLGYARALMELAGGDLRYKSRDTSRLIKIKEFDVKWHDFMITFPKGVVKNAK